MCNYINPRFWHHKDLKFTQDSQITVQHKWTKYGKWCCDNTVSLDAVSLHVECSWHRAWNDRKRESHDRKRGKQKKQVYFSTRSPSVARVMDDSLQRISYCRVHVTINYNSYFLPLCISSSSSPSPAFSSGSWKRHFYFLIDISNKSVLNNKWEITSNYNLLYIQIFFLFAIGQKTLDNSQLIH